MMEDGWKSKTVALKLRFHDFTTVSAQKTIKHWVTSAEELHAVALELLSSRWSGGTPMRLVGIGLSNLAAVETQDQLELFTDGSTKRGKVEEAVFRLQQKMGDGTLTKASLMRPESRHPESSGRGSRGNLPPNRERGRRPTSPSGRPSPSAGLSFLTP